MTEHEKYHQITIDTLASIDGLLSDIFVITNSMLAVWILGTIAIIWAIHKK